MPEYEKKIRLLGQFEAKSFNLYEEKDKSIFPDGSTLAHILGNRNNLFGKNAPDKEIMNLLKEGLVYKVVSQDFLKESSWN